MKFNKLTSWMAETKSLEVQNKEILSWLNEPGSITSRIKSFSNFRLKLLRDGPGEVDTAEDDLIITNYEENNIREVVLYSDEEPFIYAKSILPLETIRLGLGVLGNLKENPLGDILFSNPEIKKNICYLLSLNRIKKYFMGEKAYIQLKVILSVFVKSF